MADQFKFVQAQPFSLAGSGAIAGATTITLKSFQTIDGVNLAMTDFGAIGFGTLQPGEGTSEEQISFTGVTQNANGTATLTGIGSVLFLSPYTVTSGLSKTHAGSTTFIISNTSGFYDRLTSKNDDETIAGTWTFTNPNYPQMDTASPLPTLSAQLATKAYVDSVAIAGAPDASTTVKGITKISVAPVSPTSPIAVGDNDGRVPTQGENDALVGDNTDIAVGTGNKYVTQTGLQKGAEIYAATSTGNDTYVITLSPVPISYTDGMHLFFKADVGNTGSSTLNVNGLGAINLVTAAGTLTVTGDIVASQIVEVIYNSTSPVFQIVNPASAVLVNPASTIYSRVPNTDNSPDSYFTWTTPVLISAQIAGPTFSLSGFKTTNGTLGNPGNAMGTGGACLVSWGGAGQAVAAIMGNGSNNSFTAASSKTLRVKTRVQFVNNMGGGAFGSFGIADADTTFPLIQTSVTKSMRFTMNNATMYAVTGDGTNNQATDISASVTPLNNNVYEIVFIPGTSVTYYVNGVQVAQHTTNLPTGSLQYWGMGTSTSNWSNYMGPIVFSLQQ